MINILNNIYTLIIIIIFSNNCSCSSSSSNNNIYVEYNNILYIILYFVCNVYIYLYIYIRGGHRLIFLI